MKLTIAQKLILITFLTSSGVICSVVAVLRCFSAFPNQLPAHDLSIVLICMLASAWCAFSSLLLCRSILANIEILLVCARQLIAGNLSSRVSENDRNFDELGELAKHFNLLAALLEKRDRAQKQWLSDTSHELRTPLTILRAQIEALQDGIQEVNEHTLAVLHNEVMSLSSLMDVVHDLAKSDLKELRFRYSQVDITQILNETIKDFSHRFEEKELALDTSELPNGRWLTQADSGRIKQLFSHLLENAVNYTNTGGIIKVSGTTLANQFQIVLDDSSPGVPVNLLDRIFDRFYRLEGSRNRAFGGAGLGLAISKVIVSEHGGTIEAEPSKLGGLRMQLRLPIGESPTGKSSGKS